MSDTKVLNNLREAVQLDLNRANDRIRRLTEERDQHQKNAAEATALATQRGAQLDGVQDVLKRQYAAAVQASADDPGRRDLAAAVREAHGALRSFYAVTGRTPPRPRRTKPEPDSEPKELPDTASHGTVNAYNNHDCRCAPCKAASKLDQAGQRRNRLDARVFRNDHWFHPEAPHGTYNGYTNYGCRCQPCRIAGQQYNASKKEGGRG